MKCRQAGKYHGFVCGNIAGILRNFASKRTKGYVCTNDAGVLLERDPATVRGPDVTFYEDDAETMERKYPEQPRKLAVDVFSPHDRINLVMVKVGELLARGVQLVWVVDPEARDVTVHQQGKHPYRVTSGNELAGDDVLPGFRCKVDEFFAMPGQ